MGEIGERVSMPEGGIVIGLEVIRRLRANRLNCYKKPYSILDNW